MAASTRQEILVALKRNNAMTAAALSEALGITAVGVRQHLVGLERDGYVKTTPMRQKIGRPVNVYRLTEASASLFPSDYEGLLVGILSHLKELDGSGKIAKLLGVRAEAYKRAHRAEITVSPELGERVRRLCAIRDNEGFYAECYPQHDGSFRLVEHHCPIHAVAKDCPEACDSERKLFEDLLGARVVRESAVASGDEQCCFHIKAEEK